jgi:hypothetical protein
MSGIGQGESPTPHPFKDVGDRGYDDRTIELAVRDFMNSDDPVLKVMAYAAVLEGLPDSPERKVLFGGLEVQVTKHIDFLNNSGKIPAEDSQYLALLEDLANTFREKSGNYIDNSTPEGDYEY